MLHLERFNADLDGAVGYGVIDNDSVRVSEELDIPYYVNSGFLYLNLTRARNVNFTERVLH